MPSRRASTGGVASIRATAPAPARRRSAAAAPVVEATTPKKRRRSVAGLAPGLDTCAPKTDPLLEACASVVKAFEQAEGAGDPASEMLCAALPLAFRAREGATSRHLFQEQMLDVIAEQLSGIVASRRMAVDALEKQEAELEAERAQSDTIQEDIAVRQAEKARLRDEAEATSRMQQDMVNEAQVTLASARKALEEADVGKEASKKVCDDFAANWAELWAPLKNSEVSGKQWRERDNMVARLSEHLKLAGAEVSLLAVMPTALKLREDARGNYAQAALVHAEKVHFKKLDLLKEKVGNADRDIEARKVAVTVAEAGVKSAQAALDVTLEADMAAHNAWLQVSSEGSKLAEKMKTYGPRASKLQKQLVQERGEYTHLQEVFSSFEALRPLSADVKQLSDGKVAALELGVESITVKTEA